ncbi:hypothetical protein C7M84_009352 [Penaeus vannamei]|uniref:Uncharacterized protein n=1 Tax=Penaeus vannamei TaxID=6689 RepID=A0A423T759_PENVA|nr:hypothetical protein C7M84_009352 [Penaeus vannamei]
MTRLFAGPRSTSFYTPVRFASSRSCFPYQTCHTLLVDPILAPPPRLYAIVKKKSWRQSHQRLGYVSYSSKSRCTNLYRVPFKIDFLTKEVVLSEIKVQVHGPTGPVRVDFDLSPRGGKGVFVPDEVGIYELTVLNEDEVVEGCPVKINSNGVGGGDIDVTAYSPTGRGLVCPVKVEDGVYAATFQPDEAGEWSIAVTYDEEHIQGSPFTCHVYDPHSLKTGGGAKIVKPVFTVGRGDGPTTKNVGKDSKQDGSNIPRFLSYVRKPRVPNFAKIHERAFNRMEALDDYVDKKRKRTNTVGSSVKKPQVDPEKVFKPAVTSVKNLNLNFVATRSPARFGKTPVGNKESKAGNTTKTPKSVASLPHKSPKVPSKSPREVKTQPKAVPAKSPKSAKKSPKVAVTSTKLKGPHKSPKVPTQKSPKVGRPSPKAGQSQEGMKVAPASSKKVSPKSRVSALPRLLKENVKPAARPSLVSPAVTKVASVKMPQSPASSKKINESSSKIPASKPTGYVPYRGAVKPFTDRATLNKMAERNPNLKSREQIREGQKKILKGVRFNKRFELQMAKRGINLQ